MPNIMVAMDKKGKRIVQLLTTNPKISIAEISREVALTENAVRYRIEQLEKEGYIRDYRTRLEPSKFGKPFKIMFLMKIEEQDIRKVLMEFPSCNELVTIWRITGPYSVAAIGHFRDQMHMQDFIDRHLMKKTKITEIIECIITQEWKDEVFMDIE
jgi:DNA-binding Lrp family transcriptional regulator